VLPASDAAILCAQLINRASKIRISKDLISKDRATGLLNKVGLRKKVQELIRQAAREERPLAFGVIDIDKFKTINDTWGHYFGDIVIKRLAVCLASHLGERDLLSRFGGEEFVVVFWDCTLKEGWRRLDAMRQAFGALPPIRPARRRTRCSWTPTRCCTKPSRAAATASARARRLSARSALVRCRRQQFHRVDRAHPARRIQHRIAVRIQPEWIGTMRQHQCGNLQVALEGGAVQRGLAGVVHDLRIGAMFEQHLRGVMVAVVAGQHQEAVAAFVAQVGRQALAQQRGQLAGLARARIAEDAPHEGERVFVEVAG
jgi:diguanylate cyclase (GGDEF)-like protein